MTHKINFFDSVQTQSKSNNFIENYFFLGRSIKSWPGKQYRLTKTGLNEIKFNNKISRRIDRINALAQDVLKVLSYLTVVIPLMIFLRRRSFRKQLLSMLKSIHPSKLKSPKHKKSSISSSSSTSLSSDKPLQASLNFGSLSLPKDIILNHLFDPEQRNDLQSLGNFAQVSKEHKRFADRLRIDWMNNSRVKLKDMGFKSAKEAVNFFVNSKEKHEVKYLDFAGLPIDNDQLKKLTENCRNLTHLKMMSSLISEDALSNLKNIPNLIELDIACCDQLEKDALKHLVHIQNLKSLNITLCFQLEKDALKHLLHTQNLTSLNISLCSQLEIDALKHLQHTQNLTELDFSWCYQLESKLIPVSIPIVSKPVRICPPWLK